MSSSSSRLASSFQLSPCTVPLPMCPCQNVLLTTDSQFWPRSPKSSPRRHIPLNQSRACDTDLVLYCTLPPFLVSPYGRRRVVSYLCWDGKGQKVAFIPESVAPGCLVFFSISKNTRFSSWMLPFSPSLLQNPIIVLRIPRAWSAKDSN